MSVAAFIYELLLSSGGASYSSSFLVAAGVREHLGSFGCETYLRASFLHHILDVAFMFSVKEERRLHYAACLCLSKALFSSASGLCNHKDAAVQDAMWG